MWVQMRQLEVHLAQTVGPTLTDVYLIEAQQVFVLFLYVLWLLSEKCRHVGEIVCPFLFYSLFSLHLSRSQLSL